jgi:hypothetical protein
MAPLHLYQTFTVVFGPFILMKGNNIMLQTAFQQIKGKRQRAMIAFLLALFTLAILSPFGAPAYAQDTTPRDTRTWTDPNSGATFTFSTPEIFNSCSTRGDPYLYDWLAARLAARRHCGLFASLTALKPSR